MDKITFCRQRCNLVCFLKIFVEEWWCPWHNPVKSIMINFSRLLIVNLTNRLLSKFKTTSFWPCMCQGICKNRKDYFDTWKLSKRQFTKTMFAITVPKRLGIDYITILNRNCEFDFYRLLWKRLSIIKKIHLSIWKVKNKCRSCLSCLSWLS